MCPPGLDIDPNFAVKTHPTMFLPHMPNVKYAAEVKKHVTKCPVVTVGSVVTPAEAEKVLEEGEGRCGCHGAQPDCRSVPAPEGQRGS